VNSLLRFADKPDWLWSLMYRRIQGAQLRGGCVDLGAMAGNIRDEHADDHAAGAGGDVMDIAAGRIVLAGLAEKPGHRGPA